MRARTKARSCSSLACTLLLNYPAQTTLFRTADFLSPFFTTATAVCRDTIVDDDATTNALLLLLLLSHLCVLTLTMYRALVLTNQNVGKLELLIHHLTLPPWGTTHRSTQTPAQRWTSWWNARRHCIRTTVSRRLNGKVGPLVVYILAHDSTGPTATTVRKTRERFVRRSFLMLSFKRGRKCYRNKIC